MVAQSSGAIAPHVSVLQRAENFDEAYLNESASGETRAILWATTSLAVIFVSLRCYTRLFLRRVFGVDDYLMVFSMVLLVSYDVVITMATKKGLGRHMAYVLQDPEVAIEVGRLSLVSQPFVIMGCAIGKTSFAVSLMRVAAQRWIYAFLWIIIVTMNILHIMISIIVFTRCEDPRHLWDLSIPSKCWTKKSFDDFSLFVGAYSAASDFALALLPWAMLWRLQMKNKEKFGVALAMSLGVFAGSIAIIKTVHLVANTDEQDITWSLAPLLWWAGTENSVIIIAACVPTLRPLLKRMFPTSSAKNSGENNNNDSHVLVTFTNFNMFAPKSKQGEWNTIVETRHDNASDDHSDRSILNRRVLVRTNTEYEAQPANEERTKGGRTPTSQVRVQKTLDVSVGLKN